MTENKLILSKPSKQTFCTIQLTGSKSESNRALILNALSSGKVEVRNLSSADDTVTLDGILRNLATGKTSETSETPVVNIGPAGTAMRFLTAYFAVTGQEVIITGTERMKQRPIGILVDALRTLGAEIEYVEKEGYPPLKFQSNFQQATKQVDIKGNISSQFITALLLVAASLPQGLDLNIVGDLTSRPYVEMTLAMLEEAGVSHKWDGNTISIPPQPFKDSAITIEPDWSAASYWYAIAALSDESSITLPFLKENSLQGDSRISSIMESFGIVTKFTETGLELTKNCNELQGRFFDLKDCPDLAQTVIVVSAALGHNATFTGLETLKIKETDRVAALQNELAKIGIVLREDNELYHLDCSNLHFPDKITIRTYEDHRMAMAFAPLALKINQLEIEEPEVVGKSYPSFWEDLKKAGFEI
ncbi:3-phosphoshikimate 1-carboxyvinyltransferase [Pedobacter sp. SYSU D00535]|uniref:3-phosphoshikimate 1-carboxyvinyltransferase n=1 Tax=Pedobacter sp. SYSU D00535 TaxID=2810308 RepID=UPI001A97B565|nr:3-phosphoshikimate 1-carboxyvinyltransferase [Pedobacter sp. SYSU D00535]